MMLLSFFRLTNFSKKKKIKGYNRIENGNGEMWKRKSEKKNKSEVALKGNKRREEGMGEKDRRIKDDIGNGSRRPNNQSKKR